MSKKNSKAAKAASETLNKEDVIQAVVICDSFHSSFFPVTDYIPSTLMPVVNTPLLDYTLECLNFSGVQEVILFCASHTDLIKDHVQKSKWGGPHSCMLIDIIISEGCRSLGDAMRDLDVKGVIKNDFILLCGDTVANLQLLPLLEQHRKFQKQDKGAVITLLFKKSGVTHRTRPLSEETVLAADSDTHRVLFHQKLKAHERKIHFPLEMILEHPNIDIRDDLQDAGMCICSPAVPPLFSDNFDFQTRDDLIRGLLLNEEILASTIYWHMLEGAQYSARVHNWHMYQAVSHNVIHRWSYPLVPDIPIEDDQPPYMYLRRNVYRQKTATLAKGCVLEEDVLVAENTKIGENTHITKSVIGQNCIIGNNVKVSNSYIWDHVTIKDDCVIDFSVITSNCLVEKGTQLTKGCILAPGVIMSGKGEGLTVISKPALENDEYEGDIDFEQLGKAAYALQRAQVESGSEDELPRRLTGLTLDLGGEENRVESEESSGSSGMSSRASPVPDEANIFYTEVMDSMARGYEDKLQCDNLILEINSSRYAYNMSVREVNYHVVKALLNLPPENKKDRDFAEELRLRLNYFMPILQNYLRNEEAQEDCLQAIEDVANSRDDLREWTQKLLLFLYDKDLLGEDAILKWYTSPVEDNPDSVSLRQLVSPFIKWLQEADEESDSD